MNERAESGAKFRACDFRLDDVPRSGPIKVEISAEMPKIIHVTRLE